MSNEIKRFYEYLIENTDVQEKLKKNLKNIDTPKELENFMKLEIMPLAKENNFNFTLNDLMNYEKESLRHLSNEDLLSVAGGVSPKSLILSGGLFSLILLGSGTISGTTAHAALPMNIIQNSTNNLKSSKPILNNKNDKVVENNQPNQLELKPEYTENQVAQTEIKQEPAKNQAAQSEIKQEPTKNQATQTEFKQEPAENQATQTEFKQEPAKNQATQSEIKQKPTENRATQTEIKQEPTKSQATQTEFKQEPTKSQATQTEFKQEPTSESKQIPQKVIMNSYDTSSAKNKVNNNTDMAYITETLNLLDPYIYNISGTTERFRLFDGSKTQITVARSLGDNVPSWEFNKDQGEGSTNFMRCLFPSSSGKLNSDGGFASIPSFTNDCAPTPEMIAHIAAYIHDHARCENSSLKNLINKYWQDYSFGVNLLDFIEEYRPKPKPGSKPENNNIYTYIEKNPNLISRVEKSIKLRNWNKVHNLETSQDLINLVKDIYTLNNYLKSVPSRFSNKEKNEKYKTFINTYLYLLKNATYMVEKQEILNENSTNNQFLPKYTTEKMLMCYFIHHFNTENDVNQFYNEAKKIILINNNSNDKLSLQNSLERLNNVKNVLYKISQTEDCPYTEPLVENGSCQFVESTSNNTLKFNSNAFADCADVVVRHIINLLSYHDSNGWNFILGNLNNYDENFENSVNDVCNAIKSNGEIDKKPLKDRLLQFFYYQATKSTASSASQEDRTFWNYAISNMDNDTQCHYKIMYNSDGNELKCGWINCLKLTYNIIYALKSSDQSFNQSLANAKNKIDDLDKDFRNKKNYQILKSKLDQAIIATFGIMTKVQISDDNEYDDESEKFEVNENDIFTKIYISKCSNDGDIIFTFPITHLNGHAFINFSPNTTTPFYDTPEDKKLENFFYNDPIVQVLSNMFNVSCSPTLEFNCIFGLETNIPEDMQKKDTTFYINYNALRFLKESLGEANNALRIDRSLSFFSININSISNINVKRKNNSTVPLSQFIFDNYVRTRNQLICFLNINPVFGTLSKKAENFIKSSNKFKFINENNNKMICKINLDETISILYLVNNSNLVIPKEIFINNKPYMVSKILGTINNNVINVTFQEGFKNLTIGESAFSNCNQLTTFIVPESVVSLSIGFNSFNNCEKLKTFSIPDSISSLNIKSNAFYNCLSLEKFNIPKLVTSLYIESNAFSNCSSLHEFNFGNQIVSLTIDHSCFNNCMSLEKFNIPDSVTSLSIRSNAFNGCVFLKTFTISRFTEFLSIDDWAFAYCESLISFNIPIDSKINSLIIKENAFFQCSLLEKFDIPKSVTSLIINEDAFKSCQTLKSFNIESNLEYLSIDNNAFSECFKLTAFKLPASLSYLYIGDNAFNNDVNLTNFDIPNNVKIHSMFIGNNAFYKCKSLTKFSIPNSVTSLNISDGAFKQCTSLTTFDISKTVLELHIGFHSFANCSSLKNLIIPKSVTSLCFNTFAFDNCEAVNLFNIPNSVKSLTFTGNIVSTYSAPKIFNVPDSVTSLTITNFAFVGCQQLTKFTIPNSVQNLFIDNCAFLNCSNLVKFNIPKTVSQLSIGYHSFIGCSNLTEFNVPTAVSSLTIGTEAFKDCDNLKKFNFSDSVTSLTIKNGAFYNCKNLNNLQVSNKLTSLNIGNNAFYYCSSLTKFNIFNTTFSTSLSIGNNAFKKCTSLTTFNIMAHTKHLSINDSAFDNCIFLYSFNVFGAVDSLTINKNAFNCCLLFKKFNISNRVNLQTLSIEDEAFNSCPSIEEFNVPNSVVSLSIGQKAFSNCSLFKQFSIPASVNSLHIEKYAFENCANFNTFNIPDSVNSLYLNTFAFSNCKLFKEIVIPSHVTSLTLVGDNSNKPKQSIEFNIPPSVKSLTIGEYIFSTFKKTFKINIPNSVESLTIDKNAFRECQFITEFNIPESVNSLIINQNAFYCCTNLNAFNISKNTSLISLSIEENAFNNCTNLTKFNIPPVKYLSISKFAFYNCERLATFNIPKNVVSLSINDFAFYDCINLTAFNISNSVNSLIIGENAFNNCISLITFNIPESVTSLSIKANAFHCCQKLTTFNIPRSVKSLNIDFHAFSNNTMLHYQ